MKRRAFTLVELLLAVFILGIGVLGIAALLPSAIAMQQRANDDVMGPIVADNALAVLRSKLTPEMFGTLEEFGVAVDVCSAVTPGPGPGPGVTAVGSPVIEVAGLPGQPSRRVPGDWLWKRPSVIVSAGASAPVGNYSSARFLGAIDVFGGVAADAGAVPAGLVMLSETPAGGALSGTPGDRILQGVPFNRRLYPNFSATTAPTPTVLILQGERCYPMSSEATFPQPKPQYVWDCMFRRFEGRILVAIFVYRVSTAGGDVAGFSPDIGSASFRNALPQYRVGAANANAGPNGVPPPVPMCVSLGQNRWRFGGADGDPDTPFDNALVPGTAAAAGNPPPVELQIAATWQAPGQWIVDEYNVVHKVASGRRSTREGPVFLTRPVPYLEPSRALFGADPTDPALVADMSTRGVTMIWFVPTRDLNGFILQPVYATVREL